MPPVTTLVALLLAAAWHFWCCSNVITSWPASCLGVKSSTETRLVVGNYIVCLFVCWMLVLSIFNYSVWVWNSFLSSNLQDGNTALHSACYRGWYSVVKLLIDAHADLGIANKVSITKLMTSVTAIIPMQHIEPLCNACTDRYASYGNNSLSSSFSLTAFHLPSPLLFRLLCPQWQLWCHSCWQQHDNSDAVAVSLHPGQQVVWVSSTLRKSDWLWERILLASLHAECLYFLFLITVFEFGILFVL